jgi:hypothetical protein
MKKARRGFELYGTDFFFDENPGANELLWGFGYIGLQTLHLHYTMFYECIANLTTEEQRALWLPKARNL